MKIYNKYAQAAWRGLLSFDDEKFKVLVKSYVMLFISWPFVHLVANAPEFILIFVVFVLFGGFVIVLLIFNVYGSPTINTQSGRDCLFVIVSKQRSNTPYYTRESITLITTGLF